MMKGKTLKCPTAPTVLLSLGLGKHSTAATVELIENPVARNFSLDQLILITAQTGDEWRSTKILIERFLLPIVREYRIRYVQIARAGPRQRDGIVVLSDTRVPQTAHTEGCYKLSTNLLSSGVVPTVCGSRKCSLKFKGWCINEWIDQNLDRSSLRQIIGFHAGEDARVAREERFYTGEFAPIEHPLIRWGWNDEDCARYLYRRFGVDWKNSACDFCMFSGGKPEVVERYRDEPESAVKAILIERTARTLNPRITLFGRKSVEDLLRADADFDK